MNAEQRARVLAFGVRTLNIHGETADWCIHCDHFLGEHDAYCPYDALASAEADLADERALYQSLLEHHEAVDLSLIAAQAHIEIARQVAFQAQQSAAAIQGDPQKANAVSASWVIEVAGRILAALAGKE